MLVILKIKLLVFLRQIHLKKQRTGKERNLVNLKKQKQSEEEDYYIPKTVSMFWNNNYIEYDSIGDRNKNLSLDKYYKKIKPYLGDIIIDL